MEVGCQERKSWGGRRFSRTGVPATVTGRAGEEQVQRDGQEPGMKHISS